MAYYRYRDPVRVSPERLMELAIADQRAILLHPNSSANPNARCCAYCGYAGPLKLHGPEDLVCEDDDACLARGPRGLPRPGAHN